MPTVRVLVSAVAMAGAAATPISAARVSTLTNLIEPPRWMMSDLGVEPAADETVRPQNQHDEEDAEADDLLVARAQDHDAQ